MFNFILNFFFSFIYFFFFLDYCFLPPDPGFCDNGEHMNSLRYHFDAVLGKCTLFSYSGCNGNDNNFHDKRKCAETCIVHGKYHYNRYYSQNKNFFINKI